jgi:hypothetical protein
MTSTMIIILLLAAILFILARWESRLAEISGAAQDLQHRGERLYPLNQREEKARAAAAEAHAWRP